MPATDPAHDPQQPPAGVPKPSGSDANEELPHASVEAHPYRIKLDVAVLGGGFAGVYCAKALAKILKKTPGEEKQAAIVSEQNYMVFQPMLAEVAGASLSPRHVVNPIRMLCKGIGVFRGQVERIDLKNREVHINTGRFSAGVIIEFEHLVLALGAEIDLSRVPGMPEHALLMQNVGDAMILRATIISRIEEANTEARPEVRARLLSFVVVGGGYSGVETAGEMLDLLKETAKYYSRIDPDDIRVVLVHSGERILQHLSDSLGDYAGQKLQERGLELRLNDRVRAVTASRVYLQSGDVIETNTVVSTVGNAPNRIVQEFCKEFDIPQVKGAILTDAELRVPGIKNVWAAGDCAANPLFDGKEGDFCPQTAQFAMRHGSLMAKNIGAVLSGRDPEPFTFQGFGELASIGHHTAVANIMGLQFSGFIAWFMWRTIYLSKLPGLDRKLRVMIDWTLDIFFPRDINLLNPRYTSLFRQVHLESGDTLFNRGDPAFSLYVVKEGRIDLHNAEGKVVRQIEPGDFFGERTLVHGGGYLTEAKAPVPTELVSLSGEVVLPFFQASRRFRRVLAKTTAQGTPEAEIASIIKKLDERLLGKNVTEVMRADPAILRTDQTIVEALALFRHRRFSIYPLTTPEGILAGVISREDLFDFIKREDVSDSTTLDQIEMMQLPACETSATVREALERMIHHGRHKCLVTDGQNHLKGIITVMDLLGEAAEGEGLASPAERNPGLAPDPGRS